MQKAAGSFISLIAIIAIFVVYNAAYTIHETEQVLITRFGKPVGDPITNSGLHFKIPFIEEVNQIDNRFLAWDGKPNEMPTKDKTYIVVDTFARWRIQDAKQYFLRLRDERSAQSRLNDILGSETRNAIAKHELIEIVRTTKDREPVVDEVLSDAPGNVGVLYKISKGRGLIEKEIFELAGEKLKDFGIELLDIRFKRINYNETVRKRIYERMISERQQIAERFRSEGQGEAARIIGNKERDLQQIESEAYKEIQKIQGDADARATEIYASAYNQSKQSVDFYEFVKTLETYEEVIDPETTMILSTDSDLYRYLKHSVGTTD
ncbi:MAG: protease modulator HflC [Verrucomicrobia bacterium]|jgi:membrane protease subunit HflC|nr:protease modulator HflC [Verrucomicrobiota bacterium]MBT5064508.1 protease modulator HflC [Verrucomicrobiota bacterium]MBT5479040.1 protease modulator HflC [Verrucomicrobiota bacterium]MBT6237439.1 protease modulator HflC [Verrucomicrobiota bacterium]MBT6805692.1 protease modulator HflC [Verrucomicrobiota bacterium]